MIIIDNIIIINHINIIIDIIMSMLIIHIIVTDLIFIIVIMMRSADAAPPPLRLRGLRVSTEVTFGRGDLSVCPLGGFTGAHETLRALLLRDTSVLH